MNTDDCIFRISSFDQCLLSDLHRINFDPPTPNYFLLSFFMPHVQILSKTWIRLSCWGLYVGFFQDNNIEDYVKWFWYLPMPFFSWIHWPSEKYVEQFHNMQTHSRWLLQLDWYYLICKIPPNPQWLPSVCRQIFFLWIESVIERKMFKTRKLNAFDTKNSECLKLIMKSIEVHGLFHKNI